VTNSYKKELVLFREDGKREYTRDLLVVSGILDGEKVAFSSIADIDVPWIIKKMTGKEIIQNISYKSEKVSKKEIYQLLTELNKNITILMITHDQLDAAAFISRFVYVDKTIKAMPAAMWQALTAGEREENDRSHF